MKFYLIILLLFSTFCSSFSLFYYIKNQKRIKQGQSIRSVGPKTHLVKTGTPTMGGLLIIFNTILIYLIFSLLFKDYIRFSFLQSILIFIPFVGFGLIGFIDDYLSIKKGKNEGLTPKYKFILELLVSAVFYFIFLTITLKNEINFFGVTVDISFFYGVFLMLLFSGFTNATNFTDGIDGLFGLNSIITFGCIGVYSFYSENYLVLLVSLIMIFVLISFLCFNLPKASLFMGDTGSLAVGALIVSLLVVLDSEYLIIFFGFIYFVELFSVMLQVWYFKKTKGNRIFKMTPIHHHFELCGLSEYQIDILFCIINLVVSILGLGIGIKIK